MHLVEPGESGPVNAKTALDDATGLYVGHRFITAPLSKVPSFEPQLVLDIGAGAAGLARSHLLNSRKVVSTDIERRPGMDLLCGADALPFRDRTFDLVLCLRVLQHIAGDRKAIHEAHRVVRQEGIAIFAVGNRRSWTMVQARMGNPAWRSRIPYRLYRPYTARDLEAMMAEAGFTNISVETALFLPNAVKRLPSPIAASLLRLGAAIDRIASALPILRGVGTNIVAWGVRS